MIYCVGYDLKSPNRNYTPLVTALQSYGTWWHHLDSTWFVESQSDAAAIRDHLRQFLDTQDELLVFPVASGWAGIGFETRAYDWLRSHWN